MFSPLGGVTSLLLLPLLALAPAANSTSTSGTSASTSSTSASPELPPAQYQYSASIFSPWDGCTTYTPSSLASPGFQGAMEQCDGTTSPGLDGVTDFASTPATISLPLTLGAGQWEQLEVNSVSAMPLTPAQWRKLAPEGAVAPTTSGKVTALKPEVTASLSDPSAVVKKDMSADERVNVQFAAPSFKEETGDRLNQVGWLARVDVHVTATAESGKRYKLTLSELASVQGQSWYDLPEWKATSSDEGIECGEGELCAGGVVYALTSTSYSVEDGNQYAAGPSEPEPSTEPTAPVTTPAPSEPTAPAPSTEPTKPSEPTKPVEPTTKPTAPAPPLVSGPSIPVVVPTSPTTPATPQEPSQPVAQPSAPATPTAPASDPTEPAGAVSSTPAGAAEPVAKGEGTPELHADSSEPVAASGSRASDVNTAPSNPSGTATADPQEEAATAQVTAAGSAESLQLSPAQQVQLTLLLLVLLYVVTMGWLIVRRIYKVQEQKAKEVRKAPTLTYEEAAQIRNKGEDES